MADKKISALTGASTPLAGTEVLPIVQSGSTVKVAVSNLTAGRAVSGLSFSAATNIGLQNTSDTAYSGIALNSNDANAATRNWAVVSTYNDYGDLCFVQSAAKGGDPIGGNVRAEFSGNGINFKVNSGNFVVGTAGKGIDFSANTHAAGMTSELLNDYEEGTWTPTDASGAGLSLTVSGATYTKIGRQVTAQFDITFPLTVDASTQLLGGLPFVPAGQNFGGFISYTTHGAALNLLVFASGGNGVVSFRQAAGGSNNSNAAYSTNVIRGVLVYFV